MTAQDELAKPQTQIQSRAEKLDQTRRSMAEAAHRLFVERGFDNVTIDQIANEAGVARRTFFRYFPTKETVAFPYNDGLMALFRDALRRETDGLPATLKQLDVVLRAMAGVYMVNADLMAERRKFIDQSTSLLSYEQMIFLDWQRVIAEGIDGILEVNARGEAREPSYSAKIVSGAIVGALIPTFWAWYEGGAKSDLAELGSEVLSTLTQGIGQSLPSLTETADRT